MRQQLRDLFLLLSITTTTCAVSTTGAINNHAIAFASDRDGNEEIYLMRSDGSDVVRLTRNDVADVCPRWSPTGDRLVFSSERSGSMQIMVMKPSDGDADQLTELPGHCMHPSWSPTGEFIAFDYLVSEDMGHEIYVIDAAGGLRQLLGPVHYGPSWSPSGEMLVVGNGGNLGGVEFCDLSGRSHELIEDLAVVERLFWSYPVWSPDGSRILYTARGVPSGHRSEDDFDVWVYDIENHSNRRLTQWRGTDIGFDWSPDGSMILFGSDRDGNLEIYSMNSSGGEVRRLTFHEGIDSWAAWRR